MSFINKLIFEGCIVDDPVMETNEQTGEQRLFFTLSGNGQNPLEQQYLPTSIVLDCVATSDLAAFLSRNEIFCKGNIAVIEGELFRKKVKADDDRKREGFFVFVKKLREVSLPEPPPENDLTINSDLNLAILDDGSIVF